MEDTSMRIDFIRQVKLCPNCEQEKPFVDFNRNRGKKGGLDYFCRKCSNEKARARWASRDSYFTWVQRRYGLSRQAYEERLVRQNGRCAICRVDPASVPDNPLISRGLFVDHWHDRQGAARGLLCGSCNLALGYFADNIERLEAAIEYLRDYGAKRRM